MAPKITRKWEIFPGRNKFYCNGLLMTGPYLHMLYLTIVYITVTTGIFFAFDCPILIEKLTPAIPIIAGIFYMLTMTSLFVTSFTDPGIIPREQKNLGGQTVDVNNCYTCNTFRPPRSSHCNQCDNCVDRFDHHCPYIGNCIGKRNYRFYYIFLLSLAFLEVFIITNSTIHLVFGIEDNALRSAISIINAIVCFPVAFFVLSLAGFHTYLIAKNQTTREYSKDLYSSKDGQHSSNPYSAGNIFLNCYHILCGPMVSSLIDRRGVLTEEYRTPMQSLLRSSVTYWEENEKPLSKMNNRVKVTGGIDDGAVIFDNNSENTEIKTIGNQNKLNKNNDNFFTGKEDDTENIEYCKNEMISIQMPEIVCSNELMRENNIPPPGNSSALYWVENEVNNFSLEAVTSECGDADTDGTKPTKSNYEILLSHLIVLMTIEDIISEVFIDI